MASWLDSPDSSRTPAQMGAVRGGDVVRRDLRGGKMGWRALGWLSWMTCAFLTACGASNQAAHPRTTVDEYVAHLRQGETKEAYALLSEDAQRQMSFAEFDRAVRENPSEIEELIEALERPSTPPYVTARVSTPDGESLLLVYEDGAWRVDASAIDLYGQTTPEQALASFLRAYENKRYDVLMRFVPDAHREGLSEQKLKEAWEGEEQTEMAQLTDALASALPTAQVELLGDRATMTYGNGGTVELVREHGLWKIEDFQ